MKQTTTSKGRKTAAAFLCAAFAVSVAFPIGMAYANNSTDKGYSVETDQNVTWTPAENKDDCTSSYEQLQYLTIPSVECYIDAAWSRYGQPIEVGSPRYGWYQGKTAYLDNYVKEHGNYPMASLYFRSYALSYHASGVWSPDCIYCTPCG